MRLIGTSTAGQNGPSCNGNKRSDHTPQSTRTETSPPDAETKSFSICLTV